VCGGNGAPVGRRCVFWDSALFFAIWPVAAGREVRLEMSIYGDLAAVPMIEGAGGIMTDWQGNPITLESGVRVLARSGH